MRKIYFVKILLLVALCVNGQVKRNQLPQIVPKSPDIAALIDYAMAVPVSGNSGTADINITLSEISIGSFSLATGLSYHKNGLKPNDVPSSVGDGWVLKFGGAISFQQRGVNDFKPYGMLHPSIGGALTNMQQMFRGQMSTFQKWYYLEQVMAGNLDSDFDIYNYQFFGKSGSYYYDTLGKVVIQPKADLLIKRTDSTITVTDEKSNTYIFADKEYSSQQGAADVEIRPSFSDISAYYLSKVITADNRVIRFKYKSYSYLTTVPRTFIGFVQSNPNPDCLNSRGVFSNDELITTGVLLPDSIIYDQGYIKFNLSGTFRNDIKTLQAIANVPAIAGFTQYNSSGDKVKDFVFNQSYFGGDKRLKLLSVNEMNGTYVDKTWQFGYYEAGFCPALNSLDKDHWGYYNAATNSSSIPNINYSAYIPNWINVAQTSGNRNSSAASVYGMLSKIRYPTGGIDSIEYEPNQIKLRAYSQITAMSPFFSPNTTSFGPLAGASTVATGTASGSFVIPAPVPGATATTVQLHGLVYYDPSYFDDPLFTFTGPSGADLTDLYRAMNSNYSNFMSGTTLTSNALMPGTYTYTFSAGHDFFGGTSAQYNAIFDISVEQQNAPVPFLVGGVRVKRVIKSDSTGTPPLYRTYLYTDSLAGVTFRNIPNYFSFTSLNVLPPPPITPTSCVPCGTKYSVFDDNVIPFSGPTIEYTNVSFYDSTAITGIQGKTEETYLPSADDYGYFALPYVAPINRNWQAGSLLNKKVYKLSGGLYTAVQETQNAYAFTPNAKVNTGFKVTYDSYCPANSPANETYAIGLSTNFTTQFNLLQNKSISYLSNKRVVDQTDYTISSTAHTLPTIVTQLTSKGEQLRVKTLYAADYDTSNTTTAEARAIRNLRRLNKLVPIESIQYRTIAGVDYVVGAMFYAYREDIPVLDRNYLLKITVPIPMASFVTSAIVTGTGAVVKDSRYVSDVVILSYDEYNNITAAAMANQDTVTYLYDYQKLYPVAEVENALPTDVSYTSFEAEQKGNWTFTGVPVTDATAPTGTKCYNTALGSITKSGLTSSKTYLLTYWTKNATAYTITGTVSGYPVKGRSVNGWTLYSHKITGVTGLTISGGFVDELRLYPADAMMKTFTYKPYIGSIGACDEANRTSYFSFDNTGRMILLRDLDKNILKMGLYQYLISITQ